MTGMMDSNHRNHKSTQTIIDGAFTIQETNDGRTLIFSNSKDATRNYDACTGENHHGAIGQVGAYDCPATEVVDELIGAIAEVNSN